MNEQKKQKKLTAHDATRIPLFQGVIGPRGFVHDTLYTIVMSQRPVTVVFVYHLRSHVVRGQRRARSVGFAFDVCVNLLHVSAGIFLFPVPHV